MADEEETDVLEGFLCPICKADLRTAVKLVSHFEKEHTEEQDVLQTLKGLFGKAKAKAKKKFVKITEDSNGDFDHAKNNEFSYNNNEHQEMGTEVNHGDYFFEIRNKRLEHHTSQINKLLIRLDKLLQNLPSDPLKRKAHEQNVVPWIDDTHVKLCPSCGKSFHLARRKHHCRLCGYVMCNDCSLFLDLFQAKKMSTTLFSPSTESDGPSPSKGPPKLRRSNSSASLNSVLSLVEGVTSADFGFRICGECMKLFDTYKFKKENASSRPIIAQFYERLRDYMQEAQKLLPTYVKMCDSLNLGESKYELTEAQALRLKLMRLAESIDSLSKKILILGSADAETAPKGLALELQHQIRLSSMAFLRDNMVGMPVPPTGRRLVELQERRRQEVKDQIYQEQLAAQEEARAHLPRQRRRESRDDADGPQNPFSTNKPVVANTGWTPDHSRRVDCITNDPMIQQINNIRHYISEAKAENRLDEVAALETNLRELEEAYREGKKASTK